jgi:hypothetical protein
VPDENALKRAEQKLKAQKRAEFNFEVACERIDYAFDVIAPAVKELRKEFAKGELIDASPLELTP